MIAGGNKYNKLLQDFDKLILRIQKSATININESPKEKLERIAYLEKGLRPVVRVLLSPLCKV